MMNQIDKMDCCTKGGVLSHQGIIQMYYSNANLTEQLLMDGNQITNCHTTSVTQWYQQGKKKTILIFFRKIHINVTVTEIKTYMYNKRLALNGACYLS